TGEVSGFNYLSNCDSPPEDFGSMGVSKVIVTDPVIADNQAQGSGGRSGLGGGAFNDAGATLALTRSVVTEKHADGATGVVGGVYNLGTFTHGALTLILLNHASTSGAPVTGRGRGALSRSPPRTRRWCGRWRTCPSTPR